MTESTTDVPAVRVIGVRCRTTHDQSGGDIGALWGQAAAAGVLDAPVAWAVYDDYELTEGGFAVTVTVGRAAGPDEVPPEGQFVANLPAQHCACWDTDGSVEQVQHVWRTVWQRWPEGGSRSFQADAERWHPGPDGTPVRAEVFVGLRG